MSNWAPMRPRWWRPGCPSSVEPLVVVPARARWPSSCNGSSPRTWPGLTGWERREPVTYVHEVRVRYGECDMQRVVFNAHYMAYCDDAVDTWFRAFLTPNG